MKGRRGRYCHVCQRRRANEKFSGRGHARCVCKDCQRLPREERERRECLDEICGFLDQSNISAKNISRLEVLCHSPIDEVKKWATVVCAIARVTPHKRKRHGKLRALHPEVWEQYLSLAGPDPADRFDWAGFGYELDGLDDYFDHESVVDRRMSCPESEG